MSGSKDFVERRQFERYQIKEGTFALPISSSTKFGKICQVSMGGLTVRHFDGEEWEGALFESDILFNGSNICLDNVPVKILADIEITTETHFRPLSERKCVVKFEKLTPTHVSQLKDFIENHAKKTVYSDDPALDLSSHDQEMIGDFS